MPYTVLVILCLKQLAIFCGKYQDTLKLNKTRYLHGVWLAPPHEKVVVADAQVQYHLVHSDLLREEHDVGRRLLDGLDVELLVVEADVSDLGPREGRLRRQLVLLLVDVETQRRHAQPQLSVFLVLEKEKGSKKYNKLIKINNYSYWKLCQC